MRAAAPLPVLLAFIVFGPFAVAAQQERGVTGSFNSPAAAGPQVTAVFSPDGHYTLAAGGAVLVWGRHQVRGDTLLVIDERGTMACGDTIPGRYLWQRDAAGLTFHVLSDACLGRRSGLDGTTWAAASAAVLALTGGTLIDGTGAPARANVDIVTRDGKIADVFPHGSRSLPAGAEVRDVAGKWVLPGFIDAHVHLFTDPSGEDARPRAAARLRNALLGGVTAVRDMAGDGRSLAELSRAVLAGDLPGPAIYYSALFGGPELMSDARVVMSARGVMPGTTGWSRLVTPGLDWRMVVAEAKGSGATGIKLYGDIAPGLLAPIVAEAHRQGLRVWSHAAIMPARPSDAVAAGVDVLSHAPMLVLQTMPPSAFSARNQVKYDVAPAHPALDTLLRAMKARGTILEPTLWVFQSRPGSDTLPIARWANAITRRAHGLGVPIVAGTDDMAKDSGGALPNLHAELEVLVRAAGLSPMEAIVAATGTAARVLGIDASYGTIAPGKGADLLVLTADPLLDIRNTRRIALVMQRGIIVRE